jgi:protein-S-isoprenylcysteine O-methyltransferase Ste14
VIMFLGGQRNYDMAHFLGTQQWQDHQEGRPQTKLPFRTGGALRWVRHPWYSGGLALLWSFGPVTDVNLVGRIVLSLYFVVGALLEERKLNRELGREYKAYSRRVPMLVPWKGRVA